MNNSYKEKQLENLGIGYYAKTDNNFMPVVSVEFNSVSGDELSGMVSITKKRLHWMPKPLLELNNPVPGTNVKRFIKVYLLLNSLSEIRGNPKN